MLAKNESTAAILNKNGSSADNQEILHPHLPGTSSWWVQGAVHRSGGKAQANRAAAKQLWLPLRRWQKLAPDAQHFVEFNGRPVSSVKTAFNSAVRWRVPTSVDLWQAAGFLGMSAQALIDAFSHHPDYMWGAADAITSDDQKGNISVVETMADLNKRRSKTS